MKKLSQAAVLCIQPTQDACAPAADSPWPRASANRPRQLPSAGGVVRVSRESKGRGGKTVTIIKGLPLDALALAQLGKQLKAACGSGGTVKDGVIEVQGDHCDAVMQMHCKSWVMPPSGQGARWCTVNPEDLLLLVTREMPFGKHKGTLIADLPGNYLNWFAREGFPKGEIGRLLALMQEIDHNGLKPLLDPLRR
jgi:predicted translation initiation factor SUI1